MIYRDESSEFEQYIVMACDMHGNVLNKLWNFTSPARRYFQETVALGKDYVAKLKEVHLQVLRWHIIYQKALQFLSDLVLAQA